MKKLSLITEYKEFYIDSDLQKIVNNNPLPIKYTINDFDCYFYNADLFGLFEWKIQKDGITTNDFINDYQKGFEKGLLHLKEQEEIELQNFDSNDLRKGTISRLKYILHEREFKLGSKGLLDLVFNKVPLIFTEKNIYNRGYWNGIIYSIDDIIKKAGLTLDELKTSEPQQPEKGKDKKPKYIWRSKHALSEFYEKVNDNFFEDLSLDDFLDVFTESNKMRLNAINYNQTDIGYLFDNVKPYFIDKVQAKYLDWISTKVLFNGKEKKAKAISEILNFHKSKKVEYKESIDEILKSLTPFIK